MVVVLTEISERRNIESISSKLKEMFGDDTEIFETISVEEVEKMRKNEDFRSRSERKLLELENVRQQVDALEETLADEYDTPLSEEKRKKALEQLSSLLHVHIEQIRKIDKKPEPEFWMKVNGSQSFLVGKFNKIANEERFREKILTFTGELIPEFRKQDWNRIAAQIFKSSGRI
jgi:hypothetical protein